MVIEGHPTLWFEAECSVESFDVVRRREAQLLDEEIVDLLAAGRQACSTRARRGRSTAHSRSSVLSTASASTGCEAAVYRAASRQRVRRGSLGPRAELGREPGERSSEGYLASGRPGQGSGPGRLAVGGRIEVGDEVGERAADPDGRIAGSGRRRGSGAEHARDPRRRAALPSCSIVSIELSSTTTVRAEAVGLGAGQERSLAPFRRSGPVNTGTQRPCAPRHRLTFAAIWTLAFPAAKQQRTVVQSGLRSSAER